MTWFPAVSETISMAPRMGTPLLISVEKVLENRERATFLKSGPKIGRRRIAVSMTSAPLSVFFQDAKAVKAIPMLPKIKYQ